jgi:HAD superfamily hydrolase (TIGR01549 family)
MAKALLFDLDGTLLPMNTEKFVQDYIKVLAPSVARYIDPETFVKALWKSTHAMVANIDSKKTNEEVFEEAFLSITKTDKETVWPLFDDFYEKTFPTLSHLSQPTPLAKKVVEEAIQQGYRVAVATNPVFPRAAIEHRITWAGIDHIPFEVVTVYEECNFTKPHVQYYQMICDRLRLPPEECIMIGNDRQEDMSASRIGIKTFLVDGNVIDRGEPAYTIDDRGTLEELYDQLKQRNGLFAKEEETV